MERLNIVPPVQPPALESYRVSFISLDWDNGILVVRLISNTNEPKFFTYEGEIARSLMVAINKANLVSASLHRRIIQFLVADGKVSGNVTGAPD